MHSRPRLLAISTTAALLLAFGAHQAPAITINLAFDTPADQFPWYDPDGSKLEAISYAAADIWTALLPSNSHSYSVGIHYGTYPIASNTLGTYNDFDHTIKVRSNANWFLDPTPDTHEEFGPFTQEFYRDLSTSQQNSFVGAIADLLETGYFAPGLGGDAATNSDMLTVMVHEMGHFTTIGWNLLAPNVPLQSQFVGNRAGLQVTREDESHIPLDNSIMDPLIASGQRKLPTALDLIVAANEQNHSEIALKRVDWIGDVLLPGANVWAVDTGWIGGSEPKISTEVTIRNNVDVMVASAPAYARKLFLAEDSTLTVHDQLSVDVDAEVNGQGTSDHPQLFVANGGQLSVDRNLVVSLGSLELQGGSADVGHLLILNGYVETPGFINTSSLRGHGSVQVGTQVRNRGFIYAENGTLEISVDAGGTLDLDGNPEAAEYGYLRARDGNLILNGPLNDDYNSQIDIRNGHFVRFSQDWTFGAGSQLIFQESPALAEFYGQSPTSHVTLDGTLVYVLTDTVARIRAGTITLANVDLNVANGAIFGLNGQIEYHGGSYKGGGTLRQNGDATVAEDTKIEVDHYDWDGVLANPTNTTILNDRTFTIDATSLVGGSFSGRADLGDSAELSVNITGGFGVWQLAPEGHIRFLGNKGRLAGSSIIVQGRIEALDGNSDIDARTTLTDSSLVMIHDKASLNLNNSTAYGGGVITTTSGQPDKSALHQFDTALVLGHHRVTVGFFNWDASDDTDSHTTIQPRAFLDIQAKQIGNGSNQYFVSRAGFGDTLDIDSGMLGVQVGYEGPDDQYFPARWTLNKTGVMNLNLVERELPTVRGSKLINLGRISGTGQFLNELENTAELVIGHDAQIGRIRLMNTFAQTENGTMAFDLGGLIPGSDHDQLYHELDSQLAGTLNVDLLGNFSPASGDLFRIIDGNPQSLLTGTFDTVSLPSLPGTWDVLYGPYFVDLRYTVPILPGDIDSDGDVDGSDVAQLAPYLGAGFETVWSTGDFDNDGRTTLADLAIQQTHFGKILSPSPDATAVPEPGSCALAIMAVVAVGALGRRRRQEASLALQSCPRRALWRCSGGPSMPAPGARRLRAGAQALTVVPAEAPREPQRPADGQAG